MRRASILAAGLALAAASGCGSQASTRTEDRSATTGDAAPPPDAGASVKESAAAASCTLTRVDSRTWARPFRALEAVATETPAALATSASVTGVVAALPPPALVMYRK